MIARLIAIALTGAALAALWFGYNELSVFRRTVFWDYRYIIFAVGAFLGLSLLEWLAGWIKTKLEGDTDPH